MFGEFVIDLDRLVVISLAYLAKVEGIGLDQFKGDVIFDIARALSITGEMAKASLFVIVEQDEMIGPPFEGGGTEQGIVPFVYNLPILIQLNPVRMMHNDK